LQHEIDHLNGILYYEHINKQNPFFISPDWIEIK
jgi:peptide deformylase